MIGIDDRPDPGSYRLGAATGVAWFALIMAGNTMATAGTTQALRPTGEQIVSDLRHAGTVQDVGLVLELLGFTAFLVFVGFLYTTLRRADRRTWLPATALVSGSVTLAIKLGSAAPLFAAILRKDDITPEAARTLVDMNSGAFWISWLPFAVMVSAVAGALIRGRMLARSLGWIGLALGVSGVVPGVSLAVAESDYGAAPFLLSAVWLAVVSAVLTVRGPQVRRTAAAEVVPV